MALGASLLGLPAAGEARLSARLPARLLLLLLPLPEW